MSFEDEFENDMKNYGDRTDYFKPKNGDNIIRIMAEPVKEVSMFKKGICYEGAPYCTEEYLAAHPDKDGKPARLQLRYCTWIIDRTDGKLKIYTMPIKVTKQIIGYKTDIDGGWNFDEFPMPYDINIKTKRAGTLKAEYQVLPIKKERPLTEEELAEMEKATPMSQIIDRKMAKAKTDYESGENFDKSGDDSEDYDGSNDSNDSQESEDSDTTFNPEDIPF